MAENIKDHPLFSSFENKEQVFEEVKLTPVKNENEIEPHDDIFQRFERERIEWTETIDSLSQQLKDLDNLAE